jgi:ribosome-associated toxin RatA of RatAB toxin-antitoxin module
MPLVEKSALVPYSAQQMYELVTNIDQYPEFLPWCSGAVVLQKTPDSVTAKLEISFKGIRQSFTTCNTHKSASVIDMRLVDGPFKQLTGRWQFIALQDKASKVCLFLEYEFSNALLDKLIGPVFGMVSNSLVDGFIQRAETIYG